MRASQAEDTATQAFEEMGAMKDTLSDLKERLVQVTQLCEQHAARDDGCCTSCSHIRPPASFIWLCTSRQGWSKA